MTARWKALESRIARVEAVSSTPRDDEANALLAAFTDAELRELEDLLSEPAESRCQHCGGASCAARPRQDRRSPLSADEEERLAVLVAGARARLEMEQADA